MQNTQGWYLEFESRVTQARAVAADGLRRAGEASAVPGPTKLKLLLKARFTHPQTTVLPVWRVLACAMAVPTCAARPCACVPVRAAVCPCLRPCACVPLRAAVSSSSSFLRPVLTGRLNDPVRTGSLCQRIGTFLRIGRLTCKRPRPLEPMRWAQMCERVLADPADGARPPQHGLSSQKKWPQPPRITV